MQVLALERTTSGGNVSLAPLIFEKKNTFVVCTVDVKVSASVALHCQSRVCFTLLSCPMIRCSFLASSACSNVKKACCVALLLLASPSCLHYWFASAWFGWDWVGWNRGLRMAWVWARGWLSLGLGWGRVRFGLWFGKFGMGF